MPAALPMRPRADPGPWSLVDVAAALGISCDTACRDVRSGLLPARWVTHPEGGRYHVAAEDLLRSPLVRYRALAPRSGVREPASPAL